MPKTFQISNVQYTWPCLFSNPSTTPQLRLLHSIQSCNTITLNASASVNTRSLSGIKKIAKQGEEKKEQTREGSTKRSGAKKRLGSGEVRLFQSWLGSWQKAREGRQCNAVRIRESIDAHWSIGLLVGGLGRGGYSVFQSQAQRTWRGTVVAEASRGAWLNWCSRISSAVTTYRKYWPDSLHQSLYWALTVLLAPPHHTPHYQTVMPQPLKQTKPSRHWASISKSQVSALQHLLCVSGEMRGLNNIAQTICQRTISVRPPGLLISKDRRNITTDFCFPLQHYIFIHFNQCFISFLSRWPSWRYVEGQS